MFRRNLEEKTPNQDIQRLSVEEKHKSYEEKLAKYLEDSKGLNALEKHLFLFLDKNKTFSPSTIAAELKRMHGSAADLKGNLIALFNASHANNCPAVSAIFQKDSTTGYGKFLHLGTTRVWNSDGTFNEERWRKIEAFVTADQKSEAEIRITQSQLHAYLAKCLAEDPEEHNSNRNTHGVSRLFKPASRSWQAFGGSAAWDEVFDRLACGWVQKADNSGVEPYLTLDVVKTFFEDSPVVFLKAECGLLPIAKPALEEKSASRMQACA